MIYIGIDPGSKSGAYADIQDGRVEVFPWDDVFFVCHMQSLLAEQDGIVAAVEKVGAMPKQGVSSTWTFAENFGFILGVLSGLGIPFQLVPPRVWKKEYSLTSDKAKSIEVCHRLYPEANLKRTERSRTNDNNFAEAILLSEYARRHFREGYVE